MMSSIMGYDLFMTHLHTPSSLGMKVIKDSKFPFPHTTATLRDGYLLSFPSTKLLRYEFNAKFQVQVECSS